MDSISFELSKLKSKAQESRKAVAQFIQENPLMRKKREVQAHLESKKNERVEMLRHVSILKTLPLATVEAVSYGLEEVVFSQNEFVITQGERGDSFFIVQDGILSVVLQSTNEVGITTRELNRLGRGASFGEIALVTDDLRTASVVVVSETATCLKMSKTMFEKIVAEVKKLESKTHDLICSKVLETVPIFKNVPQETIKKLLTALTTVTFPASSYICCQGKVGNSFYIVMSGDCIVTLTNDAGAEKTVNELHPGDYFGE